MDNIIYEYKFIDRNDKVLCTIKTTADVDDVIREYRGRYKGDSIGYWSCTNGRTEYGCGYTDGNQPSFKVKKFINSEYGGFVYPNKRYSDRIYYSGHNRDDKSSVDIRRIIGDIMWSLYIGKIREGEVKYIKINGKEYGDIRNVRFISKEDKRVEFEEYDKDNKYRRILIPINLDSDESRLSPNSTKGLYVLVDNDKNLEMYKQKTIYQDEEAKTVDLFYGSSKGESEESKESGIFFYFNNELKSLYTYGNQKIHISDLKLVFYANEYCVRAFSDKEESFNIDIFNEGKRSTFIQDMKKQYRKFAKQCVEEKGWQGFDCKSISEASDEFKFYTEIKNESNKSDEEFEYQFELTRISPNCRDLGLKLETLGKVKKII